MKSNFTGLRGKLVPGTNRKTIIAAIDPIAHGFAEFERDGALMLDRQVGNTAARIELVRGGKRLCRADVETGAARAAMVFFRRIGGQVQRRKDRA